MDDMTDFRMVCFQLVPRRWFELSLELSIRFFHSRLLISFDATRWTIGYWRSLVVSDDAPARLETFRVFLLPFTVSLQEVIIEEAGS